MEKWLALVTPENVQYASVLLGAAITGVLWFLGKKREAAKLWDKVQSHLEANIEPSVITDMIPGADRGIVAMAAKELAAEKSPQDTNKKKAQRAFRKIFRGFILGKI